MTAKELFYIVSLGLERAKRSDGVTFPDPPPQGELRSPIFHVYVDRGSGELDRQLDFPVLLDCLRGQQCTAEISEMTGRREITGDYQDCHYTISIHYGNG
jgi:hypothetical protein